MFLQKYVDGVNAFIESRPQEHHLEFKLAGMPIGRTEHIAVGVTNAYSDTQDLYVETADSRGNIGWSATGKLSVRTLGQALVPYAVHNSQDNWIGWIPWQEMPHKVNPARGWIGTCNHLTVKRDFPYHYASAIASSYRYRRLKEHTRHTLTLQPRL